MVTSYALKFCIQKAEMAGETRNVIDTEMTGITAKSNPRITDLQHEVQSR